MVTKVIWLIWIDEQCNSQNKVESSPNNDASPARNMLARIALWSVSLSAVAAGGSVTQQFPCVTTVPACAGKGLAWWSLSSKRRWGITMLSQKKYTNVLRNVHMETGCTSEAAARRCAGIKSRFLPTPPQPKKKKKMALSQLWSYV